MKRYISGLLLLVILMGTGAWAEPDFRVSCAPTEVLSSTWKSVTHPAPEAEYATEATPFTGASELT